MSYKKPKILRRHIKECKRMLRLMYRKGLLDDWLDSDIHWASYRSFNKRYNENHLYYIEPYYWLKDYWGEHDEHSLLDRVLDNHIWHLAQPKNPMEDWTRDYHKWFKDHNSFKKEMEYLRSLPTKRCDSGINKYLKVNLCEL